MPRLKGTRAPNQVLLDMRHVYKKPESEDETDGQRTLRKMFKEDAKEFISKYTAEEHRHQTLNQRGSEANKDEPKEEDPGTEKALEILDKWIEDWYAKHPEVERDA